MPQEWLEEKPKSGLKDWQVERERLEREHNLAGVLNNQGDKNIKTKFYD